MRRIPLLALLLAPSLVLAQVTVNESGDKPDGMINIAECQGASGATSTMSFRWTFSNVTFTNVDVRVSDTSGCPASSSNSTAHTSSLGTFSGNQTTTSIASPDLLSRLAVPSSACGTGANLTIYVCCVPKDSLGNEVVGSVLNNSFLFDRTIPATPLAPNVEPGDSALRVSWEPVSGSRLSYRVEVRLTGQPDSAPVRVSEVAATSVRIGNLEVGTTYDVVVIAISEAGNWSAASPAASGTPVLVDDFWRLYQNDGGREHGGCSTAGGASLALLAFVPLALRRRRS